MMKDWKEIKLGEICTIKHGWAFKGEFFTKEGVKIVVTPGNFFEEGGFRLQVGKEKFYSADFPKEYLLKKDDLVIAMTEQGEGLLGSPALIPCDDRYLHNQRIGLFQDLDENIVCKKFIYYVFFTKEVRGSIASSATGTKVKHTAPKRIYSINLKLPPLETQQKIASILSAYDDLIENNLRRIKLLEEMAAITYKEWFVNFIIEGEKLEIDETTGLPFGWERKKIGEVCSLSGGGTPSKIIPEYWNNGNIAWYSPTDLSKSKSIFQIDSNDKITELGLKKSSSKLLLPDSFMMSSRATIGLFGIVDKPFSTNQGFINITPKRKFEKEYLFYNLKSRVEEFKGYATGSTFPELGKTQFRALAMVFPNEDSLIKFHTLTSFNHIVIGNLSHQNRLLKESRDILLPRLMSGAVVA